MLLNFTVGPSVAEQQRLRQVKAAAVERCRDWAIRVLWRSGEFKSVASADEISLSVLELKCLEVGCPPLETCFAVLNKDISCQFKVLKALVDVAEDDISFSFDAWRRGEDVECNCGQFALPNIDTAHPEAENIAEMKHAINPLPANTNEEIDAMLAELSSGTL